MARPERGQGGDKAVTGAQGSRECRSRRDRSCRSTAVTACGSGPRNRHRLGSPLSWKAASAWHTDTGICRVGKAL